MIQARKGLLNFSLAPFPAALLDCLLVALEDGALVWFRQGSCQEGC